MNLDREKTPIIGICVSEEKRALMRIVGKRLERYPKDVTVITFIIENLDINKLIVKGDCFVKKLGEVKQNSGIFPIPTVIYMQSYAEPDLLRKIEEIAGCKIFNNFIFEKWQEWNLLANNPVLSSHLPHTQKLNGKEDLKKFLFRYQDVFIKPISPTKSYNGKGIVRIKIQKKDVFEAIYQKKNGIIINQFKSYGELWKSIQPMLTFNAYILQQCIVTTKFNDLPTDIRMNMNKSGIGKWAVSALFGRVALNGSHVSIEGGAQYLPIGNKLFMETLLTNDKNNTKSVVDYITDIGYKICETFDQSGYHMADLGIDLGMDLAGHIWIFEVNPLPFPFALPIRDDSWSRPLEYAQYLLENEDGP